MSLLSPLEVAATTMLTFLSGCMPWSDKPQPITRQAMSREFNTLDEVKELFPLSIAQVDQRAENAIAAATEGLAKILAVPAAQRTFANTAKALDDVGNEFGILATPISLIEMVSPDDALRQACRNAIVKLDEFSVDIFASPELYHAFKDYADGNAKTERLSDVERYYVDEELRDFLHAGLALPQDKLAHVKELKKQLGKKSLAFSSNIAADQSNIVVGREALGGLSDEFIAGLKKNDDGNYILGTDYPTYLEVIQYCRNADTRKNLYLAFNNRAYPANVGLLEEVIDLRSQMAKEIGFESFAHLSLESKMAKTPERAEKFVRDLLLKVAAKEKQEFEQLKANLPEGIALTQDGKFQPWDLSFVKAHVKKKLFDVDERKIAEYFPMEKTEKALFSIYQQFFGIRFEQEPLKGFWHEDLKLMKVFDEKSDELLGYIILDLHPRANKYSHACQYGMVPTVDQRDEQGNALHRPCVTVVIANFSKSTPSKPSLLKHAEVTTFFHEFGHAMHTVLGKTQLASHAGTSVKRDFVEMPSQMFEEWMWDRDMLGQVSGHYQTGEALPDALIDKMVALKKFDSGYHIQRQCCLSLLSLAYFNAGSKIDTSKTWADISSEHSPHIRFEPDTHFQGSFGHLMGYGAGYYGYLWSRVFALDFFEKVREKGLLNREVGMEIRNNVLGKGGSVDPNLLVSGFLGREPNQDAFLRDLGLDV